MIVCVCVCVCVCVGVCKVVFGCFYVGAHHVCRFVSFLTYVFLYVCNLTA